MFTGRTIVEERSPVCVGAMLGMIVVDDTVEVARFVVNVVTGVFTQRHDDDGSKESALAGRRTIERLTDVLGVGNVDVVVDDAVGCVYGAD